MKKLTTYHILLLLLALLVLLKYELIYNGVVFVALTFYELIFNTAATIKLLDFRTLDFLFSIVFLFILPPVLHYLYKNYRFLKIKFRITYLVFLLLMLGFIFAPLLSNFHPNAQPSVRATRFLNPLSSVMVLTLKEENSKSKFLELKDGVINNPTISNKLFVNSYIEKGSSVLIKQGNKESTIEKDKLIMNDGNISIDKKYFIFGTDELGRDVFSRIIYGARVSIFIAVFTVVISLTVGLWLGFLAAYFGGLLNMILSRLTDVFLTIPSIFFVIMILALWGNSIFAVILVLGLTGWMQLFKIVKGEVSSNIQKDYFVTSKKLGFPLTKLLSSDIIPAILLQLSIFTVFQFSNVILAESSLSYLGLGVGLNYPSWGNMILSGQKYMTSGEWLIIIPSFMLVISILAINDLGEKIKKELNPRIKNDK